MTTIRTIALYLLVIFTTFYVSIGVFTLICPFAEHFDTVMYAKYWKIVDGYMGRRMSIFKPIWMLVFLFNLIVFFKTWRKSPIFWIVLSSFVILIWDILFTIKAQIPINKYFQSIDVNHLTAEQITIIQSFRNQTTENFEFRKLLVVIIFLMIVMTPYLYRRLNQQVKV